MSNCRIGVKEEFAVYSLLALFMNEQLFLSQGLKNFVSEAFDCIAQSSSAIKVSSRCHVNAFI